MKKTIEINIPDGYRENIKEADSKIIINFVKVNKNKAMEDFFKLFLTDLLIVIMIERPNSVFYKKDGEVIFELYQDSNNKNIMNFWVDYYKIWKVFSNKFGLSYDEIQSFIKMEVNNVLKLETTPTTWVGIRWQEINGKISIVRQRFQ